MTLNWYLYQYDDINQLEPFNLSTLNVIPKEKFEDMASNPINELNLAIKPDTLQVGKKYTIAFRAARASGVYGECRTTVIINSPPVGGKILIFLQFFSRLKYFDSKNGPTVTQNIQ